MEENHSFSNDQIENEHLQHYIEKKAKKNSRLRVGRKNKKIKKYRRHRLLKTALPLLLIFLTIGLVSGYFVSPFSKVKTVEIRTSSKQETFDNKVPIHIGDSLLMIKSHKAKIDDILKKDDINVKDVKIKWQNHNQALVKINFYNFYAYLKKGKQYYPVNARGEIRKEPTKLEKNTNEVILSNFFNSKQVQVCLEQYDKLPNSLKSNVKEIRNEANANDVNKVKIILQDGNQVILQNNSLADKMAFYPDIKKTLTRPSVVNLEYGAYSTPIHR